MSLSSKSHRTSHIPLKLRYRLYRMSCRQSPCSYYLEITLGNDRFLAPLKTTDKQKAEQIYILMLNGKVTPCTAQDVLEDICS